MRKIIIILLLLIANVSFAQYQIFHELDGKSLKSASGLSVYNNDYYFIDSGKDTFCIYSSIDDKIKLIDRYDIYEKSEFPQYLHCNRREFDSEGTMYQATQASGVIEYKDNEWKVFNESNSNLIQDLVPDLSISESNEVYVSTASLNISFIEDDTVRNIGTGDDYRLGPDAGHSATSIYFNNCLYYRSAFADFCYYCGDTARYIRRDAIFEDPDSEDALFLAEYLVQENKIWMVTQENTLLTYDGENFENQLWLKQIPEANNRVHRIRDHIFDKKGNYWILFMQRNYIGNATLYKFNKNKELVFRLNSKETPELKDEIFAQLAIDESNNENDKVYLKTYNGLMIFDPDITSVDEVEVLPSLYFSKLFPNPVSSTATVVFYSTHKSIESVKFRLTDYLGREVEILQPEVIYDRTSGKATAQLDVNGVHRGYYYLLIQSNEYTVGKAVVVE
jgi:Secretion system C-terminal sorting domain